MNIVRSRERYIERLVVPMIDRDMAVDEIAAGLKAAGTRDEYCNDWNIRSVDAFLEHIGFPYYSAAHQPIERPEEDADLDD